MRRALLAALLLLPTPVAGAELNLDVSVFKLKDTRNYRRQVGYERWRGEHSGVLLLWQLSQKFKIKRGAWLKLTITSGTAKVPYVTLFTSPEDSLFGTGKQFTVKELYFHKDNFIFNGLIGSFGKQHFEVPAVYNDYLWGGRFIYRYSKRLSLFWNQVAGYEGRYLLTENKKEDDVDLFAAGINYRWRKALISFGVYRISDALGPQPGIAYNGLFLKADYGQAELQAATQNGKKAFIADGRLKGIKVKLGYAQKGFTSYGYREAVFNLGTVFKPDFSNLKFAKLSTSLNLYPFTVKPYVLSLKEVSGKKVGDEAGAEIDYPLAGGWLYLKAGAGSSGSYGYFFGYKRGLKVPVNSLPQEVKVKNSFSLTGEYTDLPHHYYRPQLGYEGWERALHVGYWHTTYRLTVKGENWKAQVATGPSSKVDYLVWGNTHDNYIHRVKEGKEWHLEELFLSKERLKLGMQRLSLPSYVDDYLTGMSGEYRGVYGFLLYTSPYGSRPQIESEAVAGVKRKFSNLGFYAVFQGNGFKRAVTAAATLKLGKGRVTLLKQSGRGWGLAATAKARYGEVKGRAKLLIYSDRFTTFGVKEFYRDLAYTFRPTLSDMRFFSLEAAKPLHFGSKKLSRLKPRFALFYHRLNRFSGKFVAQEAGFRLSVKPGRFCRLSLVGAVGSNSSYYEALNFSVNW